MNNMRPIRGLRPAGAAPTQTSLEPDGFHQANEVTEDYHKLSVNPPPQAVVVAQLLALVAPAFAVEQASIVACQEEEFQGHEPERALVEPCVGVARPGRRPKGERESSRNEVRDERRASENSELVLWHVDSLPRVARLSG